MDYTTDINHFLDKPKKKELTESPIGANQRKVLNDALAALRQVKKDVAFTQKEGARTGTIEKSGLNMLNRAVTKLTDAEVGIANARSFIVEPRK
jgi:hypothetical protein